METSISRENNVKSEGEMVHSPAVIAVTRLHTFVRTQSSTLKEYILVL